MNSKNCYSSICTSSYLHNLFMLMYLSEQYSRYIYLLYLMLKLFITIKFSFWAFHMTLIMKSDLLCQSSTLLFFFDNYCFILLLQMGLIILLTEHFTKRWELFCIHCSSKSYPSTIFIFLACQCCQEEPSRLWYIESWETENFPFLRNI